MLTKWNLSQGNPHSTLSLNKYSITVFVTHIELSKNFYPRITTIAQPMYDMGSVAMRMLIKLLGNQELDKEYFELPYELIERESC